MRAIRTGRNGQSQPAGLAVALAFACLLGAAPATAQETTVPPAAPANRPAEITAMVAALKPGEFLWWPQVAPAGPTLLMINRTTQRAVIYRNGIPIGISTVSTGKPGHRTPVGVFQVLEKQVEHYSTLYNNAPMPFMQRLTWGGVALHGGQLPGYPASHGCIRLPVGFAKLLYAETSLGMTVMVTDRPALPTLVSGEELFGAPQADPGPSETIIWRPELAPTGPVTIILSGADRRVVVLRAGREIGSAPVVIDAPIERAALYTLQSAGADGPHWLRVSLPGEPDEAGPAPEPDQFHVAESFRAALVPILTSGTTVLLVKDSLEGKPAPKP